MRKIHLMSVLALSALLFSMTSTAFAVGFVAPPVNGTLVENAVNLIYNPADGGLSMTATGLGTNGSALLVTTLELQSEGKFNPDLVCPTFTGGAFDVATANKLFMLRAGAQAVGEQCLGTPMPTGLTSFDDVNAVFTKVDGSVTPSGKLNAAPGGGPFLHVVPEPSSILLTVFGLLGLVGLRRKA